MAELVELAKKMRVAASMPKESLKKKRKAPTLITQTPTGKDEETTFGLVFKRKRKKTIPLIEHSRSRHRSLRWPCSIPRRNRHPRMCS